MTEASNNQDGTKALVDKLSPRAAEYLERMDQVIRSKTLASMGVGALAKYCILPEPMKSSIADQLLDAIIGDTPGLGDVIARHVHELKKLMAMDQADLEERVNAS